MIIDKSTVRPANGFVGGHNVEHAKREVHRHQDNPPPYVGPEIQSFALADISARAPDLPQPSGHNSVFQSALQQHVNHISLSSKHNPVSGSYIIDPDLTGGIPGGNSHDRIPLDRKNRKLVKTSMHPNAVFRTRHGPLSLNLATAGTSDIKRKTFVQVASRHGKINVNLFALQPNRPVCLELLNKHGHTVLFLPPNFKGALRLRSRRGNVAFLPAFAQHVRVVHGNDKEALVLFGVAEVPLSDPATDVLDYCFLSTSHGKVTIGLSGVDQLDDPRSGDGLFKKLGALLLGSDVMRS